MNNINKTCIFLVVFFLEFLPNSYAKWRPSGEVQESQDKDNKSKAILAAPENTRQFNLFGLFVMNNMVVSTSVVY